MAISDSAIRAAKPKDKPYKLSDDESLFLLIAPSGSKPWRLKYRFGGQEKLLSFGAYPTISLKDARERRDEARKLLANHVDRGEKKSERKSLRRYRRATLSEILPENFWTNSKRKGLLRPRRSGMIDA